MVIALCFAASQTMTHSSHPLHRDSTMTATVFEVSIWMQLASGQYMMQSRHPFWATHASAFTSATLYIDALPDFV
jgi:hypothetical protein